MTKQIFLFLIVIFCTINTYSLFAQDFEDLSETAGIKHPGSNYGVAIADLNSDGLDDIYVTRRDDANKLFINKGEFQFEEKAEEYGLSSTADSHAAVWVDFDNDGDLDLFVVNNHVPNQFFRNDNLQFTEITDELGIGDTGKVMSVHTVDYNQDGYLDIYIAYFLSPNILYKNEAGERFTNATASAGINHIGPSMGAVFFDFDNDGDQDLYQTHDGNIPNLLFKNNGNGTFDNISEESNADYAGNGMGVDAGDINNDGFIDLYITNLYENTLLINKGDGTFENLAGQCSVDDLGMGWGLSIFDYNNDGYEDIYVANESDFHVNGNPFKNILYTNNSNLVFESLPYSGGIQNMYSSYGSAIGDFNNDGSLDLFVTNKGEEGNQIFRNNNEGSFLDFKLVGKESNSQAIGARISLYSDGNVYLKEIKGASGYVSQNTGKVHFGLEDITIIDSITVRWPNGEFQSITEYELNSTNIIIEDNGQLSGPVVWSEPPFPTQFDDVTIYFNAKEGNGGLAGFDGDVYAHTGVITENSSNPTDWKYVVGQWGTDVPETKMTSEGDDIYSLSYNIQEFYGVPEGELVEQLAFVFRSVDGSVTGRAEGGGDIFLDVYPPEDGLFAILTSPDEVGELIYEDDSLDIIVSTNQLAKFELFDNGELIYSDSIIDLNYNYKPVELGIRNFEFVISLNEDTIRFERFVYVLERDFEQMDAPTGLVNGLNYYSDSSFVFKLFAPNKAYVFFLSYANDWLPDRDFRMRQSLNGDYFWIEVPKDIFIQGETNAYTYLMDRSLIGDPFSTLVLDPFNDEWVPSDVMDELPEYPSDRLFGAQISVFDVEKPEFPWTDQEYEKPGKDKLVVYELLMRDFLDDQNYKTLKDTLGYLKKLGINAIEFMPVSEFEGNQSWGYNPSFHMALDKAYGSIDQFKAVVNEAHNLGIAVILDVVYNHVFSTSPLARMYWDDTNFRPTAENPYLNVTARHPFNVGYDANHESLATQEWVKQTLKYWIEEFHIDGFRFDLSKGFTQKNSGSNVGEWGQYDPSRVSILKDYADFMWSIDPTNYVILEHFADNEEETILANYGMMLWGNATHDFGQAAEGRSSSLDWIDYRERGWNDPNIVSYMESHDEERMMYKLLNFGLSEGGYDTRDPEVALTRVAAAATIFYMVPGPKMLWQFGELGYDYSINWCTNGTVNGCRLDPKPVRWDYLEEEGRANLRQVIENLLYLRNNYPTFTSLDFDFNDGNFFLKTIHHNHPDMDAVTMVNYRVINSDINPKFPYEGMWYEYFTGDSLNVVDTQEKITHGPGEYRIYTSKRITPPGGFIISSTNDIDFSKDIYVSPNPSYIGSEITVDIPIDMKVDRIELMDNLGQRFSIQYLQSQSGKISINTPAGIAPGIYHLQLFANGTLYSKKISFIQ